MKIIDKAVVISDLHLGVPESLFYSLKYNRFQDTMNWLTQELTNLGTIDELIFLGDLFDLSLAPYDVLHNDAIKFFDSISKLTNIKEIVYVPGNHDHHFWINHVEQDQIIDKMKKGKAPDEKDYFFKLVDSKYPLDTNNNDILIKYFFSEVITKLPEISMKYATHLRQIGDKYYLFTHGHFLEDAFTPLQFLMEAVSLEDLEAFNILWVEAIDYHLGHSGRLSDKVRQIYHDCIKNNNKAELNKIIKETLEYFRIQTGLGKMWIWAIKIFINKMINKKISSKNKAIPIQVSAMRNQGCSDKLREKIKWYIKKFILDRYRTTNPNFSKDIPFPFTFVFGHTHDYFKTQVTIDNDNYDIYNTGGWTIDDETREPRDAGILVIDKNGCEWKIINT